MNATQAHDHAWARITSPEAASREKLPPGSFALISSKSSYKFPGGFTLRCADGSLHQFGKREIETVDAAGVPASLQHGLLAAHKAAHTGLRRRGSVTKPAAKARYDESLPDPDFSGAAPQPMKQSTYQVSCKCGRVHEIAAEVQPPAMSTCRYCANRTDEVRANQAARLLELEDLRRKSETSTSEEEDEWKTLSAQLIHDPELKVLVQRLRGERELVFDKQPEGRNIYDMGMISRSKGGASDEFKTEIKALQAVSPGVLNAAIKKARHLEDLDAMEFIARLIEIPQVASCISDGERAAIRLLILERKSVREVEAATGFSRGNVTPKVTDAIARLARHANAVIAGWAGPMPEALRVFAEQEEGLLQYGDDDYAEKDVPESQLKWSRQRVSPEFQKGERGETMGPRD